MTDYETTWRTFRLHVPDDYEFTRDVVEHWAAQHPGKLALVALDPRGENRREISFGDLARASRRVANALEGLGITAGERAFVMLPRIPEWYELLLGMFRHGVIPMPATTLCTARDIAQRIERAQATVAVVDDEAAAKLATVRDQCSSLRHVIVVGTPVRRPATSATTTCSRAPATRSRPRRVDARRRSAAPVLHLGHRGGAEDGAPHARLDGRRPRDHRALLAGPDAGRPALDVLRHRLGQGGVGEALRPVAHGRVGLPLGSARQARSGAVPARAGALRRDHLLRAADALPRLRAARPRRLRPDARAPHRLGRRAAQPRGHPRLARGHRHDDLRRLRADRDRQPGRQLPLPRGAPGLDGQADAGQRRRRRLGRRRAPRARRGGQHRARHRARAAGRADAGVLARRRRQRRGLPRRLVLHGRPRRQGRGRLPLVRQPLRRRHHLGLVPHRPLRGRVRAGRAPGRGRVRRRRQARPGPHEHRQGVRRAGAGTRGLGRARARAAGARQDASRRPTSTRARSSSSTSLPKTISGKIRRSELRQRS